MLVATGSGEQESSLGVNVFEGRGGRESAGKSYLINHKLSLAERVSEVFMTPLSNVKN